MSFQTIGLCQQEDTWVVAVYVAVVQDERDALQFSHLKEPEFSELDEGTMFDTHFTIILTP